MATFQKVCLLAAAKQGNKDHPKSQIARLSCNDSRMTITLTHEGIDIVSDTFVVGEHELYELDDLLIAFRVAARNVPMDVKIQAGHPVNRQLTWTRSVQIIFGNTTFFISSIRIRHRERMSILVTVVHAGRAGFASIETEEAVRISNCLLEIRRGILKCIKADVTI
jgi:hypothetical protein